MPCLVQTDEDTYEDTDTDTDTDTWRYRWRLRSFSRRVSLRLEDRDTLFSNTVQQNIFKINSKFGLKHNIWGFWDIIQLVF